MTNYQREILEQINREAATIARMVKTRPTYIEVTQETIDFLKSLKNDHDQSTANRPSS